MQNFNLIEKVQFLKCARHGQSVNFLSLGSAQPQPQCGMKCTIGQHSIQISKIEDLLNDQLQSSLQSLHTANQADSLKQLLENTSSNINKILDKVKRFCDDFLQRLGKAIQKCTRESQNPIMAILQQYDVEQLNQTQLIAFAQQLKPFFTRTQDAWVVSKSQNESLGAVQKTVSVVKNINSLIESAILNKNLIASPDSLKVSQIQLLQSICDRIDQNIFSKLITVYQKASKKSLAKELSQDSSALLSSFSSISSNSQRHLIEDYLKKQLKLIDGALKELSTHEINLAGYFSEPQNSKLANGYFTKENDYEHMFEFLMNLVRLTAVTDNFVICGSNAAYLLNQFRGDFSYRNLSGIKLANTKLSRAKFFGADLSESSFQNVDISGCDFSQANLARVAWQRIHQPLQMVIRREAPISSIQYLRPQLMAIATSDGSVAVVDYIKSKIISEVRSNQSSGIKFIALSSDGNKIVTSSSQIVELSQRDDAAQKFQLTKTLSINNLEEFTALTISPNGSILAYATNLAVRTLELSEGKQQKFLYEKVPSQLTFSRSGGKLAVGDQSGTVKIFNPNSSQTIFEISGNKEIVTSISFSPDEAQFAFGQKDASLQVWNLNYQNEFKRLQGHQASVLSLAFGSTSNILASGSQDNMIRIWDLNLAVTIQILQQHQSDVNCLAISPDGLLLASGGSDQLFLLWNLNFPAEYESIPAHQSGISALSFANDGRLLASADQEGIVIIRELDRGKALKLCSPSSSVTSLAFSPDGKLLAVANQDQTVRIWDVSKQDWKSEPIKHLKPVLAVAFAPQGDRIASGGEERILRVFDTESGKPISASDILPNFIDSISYSPDGSTVACACSSIMIFNVGRSLVRLDQLREKSEVLVVDYFKNMGRLAAGYKDFSLKVWDIQKKEVVNCIFNAHKDWIRTLKVTADSSRLISGSLDHTVKIHGVHRGKELQTLACHKDQIYSVLVTSDQSRIFSGGLDNRLLSWTPNGGDADDMMFSISKDGQYLASYSASSLEIRRTSDCRLLAVKKCAPLLCIFPPNHEMLRIAERNYRYSTWEWCKMSEKIVYFNSKESLFEQMSADCSTREDQSLVAERLSKLQNQEALYRCQGNINQYGSLMCSGVRLCTNSKIESSTQGINLIQLFTFLGAST